MVNRIVSDFLSVSRRLAGPATFEVEIIDAAGSAKLWFAPQPLIEQIG
jgi:hypothetical protein